MASGESSPPRPAAKAALALLLMALGVWTLHRYLPALIWAAILAIAVWPLYQRAERRWPPGPRKILLPAGFTLALALVCIIPLVVLAIQAGNEVHGLYDAITQARSEGIPPPQWLARLPLGGQEAMNWWDANLARPDSANALLQRARESDFVSNSRELGANIAHRVVLF
ncbi:MAG TPA: AI-2E family transporter, partial [Rhodopila sp.]|nr:AI-2E family transporter [Rhodopila sp.]